MPADTGTQITVWSIVSLLAGTVISAIVSYLLQRNSFGEARRQKAQDKFEERKVLALTLFQKMIRIASTLEILKNSVEPITKAAKKRSGLHPWQIALPLANFPDSVLFSPEERTFLLLMDKELFSDMGPFDDIHNSLLEMFTFYRTRRMALYGYVACFNEGERRDDGTHRTRTAAACSQSRRAKYVDRGYGPANADRLC
jgi:hypothetical protein